MLDRVEKSLHGLDVIVPRPVGMKKLIPDSERVFRSFIRASWWNNAICKWDFNLVDH